MAKKICALLALILALALLVACNAQPDVVEVTRVVEATRDIDAEAVAIGAAVKDAVKEGIAESQPTPTNTPRPTATATPDGLAAAVATLAASAIEVQLPPPVAATFRSLMGGSIYPDCTYPQWERILEFRPKETRSIHMGAPFSGEFDCFMGILSHLSPFIVTPSSPTVIFSLSHAALIVQWHNCLVLTCYNCKTYA